MVAARRVLNVRTLIGMARAAYGALASEYPPGFLCRPTAFGPARLLGPLAVVVVAIPGPYILLSVAGVSVRAHLIWLVLPSMYGLAQVLNSACQRPRNIHLGYVLPDGAVAGQSWLLRRRAVACDGFEGRYELVWRPWAVTACVLLSTVLIGWRVSKLNEGLMASGALLPLAVLTLSAGLGVFCIARVVSSLVFRARMTPLGRCRDSEGEGSSTRRDDAREASERVASSHLGVT